MTASSTGLWAERLSVGVTHALGASLASKLADVVVVTGQPEVPPSRQFMVDVQEFDIGADGHCLLNARWETIGGNGKVLRRESDSFIEQAAPARDESVAAAMTRAINRLALRIVATSRNPEFATAGEDQPPARGRPAF